MTVVPRRMLASGLAAGMFLSLACSDKSPTAPFANDANSRELLSPSFTEGSLGSVVTFNPGNTSDPGASATGSIPSLQAATQGVAFKLRIRGDVFTNLRSWDSRTLFSIDDGTAANRKVEVTVERSDRGDVRVIASWSGGVVVQTAFMPVTDFAPASEYVIYAHFNNAASPQRELALLTATGAELQRVTADYSAGDLSTASGNAVIHVMKGLSNWSASGTIDGLAVYAFPGAGVLSGAARAAPPSPSDAGIVSLVAFDDGAGATATNAVAGAPSLQLQSPQWSAGGTWVGLPSVAASAPPPPTTSGANGGIAIFAPGNSGNFGAVATGSITALENARQGIAIKLRVKGDVFTKLAPWDSRTVLSISDGTYGGRKIELVAERDDQDQVHLRARWTRQEIATAYVSRAAFDPSRYYVIYSAYNDYASPERQLAIFDDAGAAVQQTQQNYAAGDLPAPAGGGVVSLATGLSNWSANGTVDGLAIYVFTGSAGLVGAARYSAPSPSDAGIVSLVTFTEGSGTSAANAVAGAPPMNIPAALWGSGGSWGTSDALAPPPLTAVGTSPPTPSAPNSHEPSNLSPLIRYDAGVALPGHTTLGKALFYNFNGYNAIVPDAAAPLSPDDVLRFAYPGGPGHESDAGQTSTEPGNLFMPFAESTEFYESGWFRVGDGPDFEMLDITIWKPLGFIGSGDAGAKSGLLQSNQLYLAAWTFPNAQGRISGMRLGLGNQTSQAEGLNWSYSYGNDLNGTPAGGAASAGLTIDPHPELPVGQWIHYEVYLKTNSISPNLLDDGVAKIWASWNGRTYLVLNRDDLRFRTPSYPLGFFNRQLAPTFGGTSKSHQLRSRFDYLYFDDIYISGAAGR